MTKLLSKSRILDLTSVCDKVNLYLVSIFSYSFAEHRSFTAGVKHFMKMETNRPEI